MTPRRGLGPLIVGLGLAVPSAGCSDPPRLHPPGPHAAPTGPADCDDLPGLGGDPGILLGTDWSGEHHDPADTVVVYACVSVSLGGRVSLVADGPAIRIRPRVVPVDASGSGIIPFRVTVASGASGGVRIQQEGGGGGGDLPGPVVAADGDGWHFVPRAR